MPEVTVKSFSELIHTPLYGQLRILNEQKYPRQAPGFFKIQYYRPALTMIRRYYNSGNNPTILPSNPNQITGAGSQEHKRENNFRAIKSFRNGSQAIRKLTLYKLETWELALSNIIIRCTPDLYFDENGKEGISLLDCREQQPELEIIHTTVELFHRALVVNGVQIPIRRIEYIHLCSDTVYFWKSPRQKTINRASQTAEAIETLWDSI